MDGMDGMDYEMERHGFTISYGINWLEKRRNGRVSLSTRPIPSFQPMPKVWSKPEFSLFSWWSGEWR